MSDHTHTLIFLVFFTGNLAAVGFFAWQAEKSVTRVLKAIFAGFLALGLSIAITFVFFLLALKATDVELNAWLVYAFVLAGATIFWLWVVKFARQRPDISIETIVNAYGAVLAPGPIVRNEQELPYSKKQIKTALIAAMTVTENKDTREQLVVGYLSLSDFQALSKDQISAIRAFDMTNSTAGLTNERPIKLAKELQKYGDIYRNILGRVSAEQNALAQELEAIGVCTKK